MISHFPLPISNEAIKNTHIRIIHMVRSGEDLTLSESISRDERERSTNAPVHMWAVVNLPYRSSNLLVKISPDPPFRYKSYDSSFINVPSFSSVLIQLMLPGGLPFLSLIIFTISLTRLSRLVLVLSTSKTLSLPNSSTAFMRQ